MVFKRKRKSNGRKRFTKRKFTARRLNKRIRRIESSIETKAFESGQTGAFTGGTVSNTVWSLATITQGLTYKDRIGNKITATSLSIRGRVHWGIYPESVTNTGGCRTMRLMIVWDTQANGNIMVLNDMISSGPVFTYYVPIDWDVRKRFRVIWDKQWIFLGRGTNTAYNFKKHFKLKRRKILYSTGANTIEKNALYAIWISDGVDTSNLLEYEVWNRLKYQDC